MTRDEIKAMALAAIQGANPWTPEALASALAERLAPVDLQARYDVLLRELRREREVGAGLVKQVDALKAAGNALAVAAVTSGGTAGQDEGLVEKIDAWTEAAGGMPLGRAKTFGGE